MFLALIACKQAPPIGSSLWLIGHGPLKAFFAAMPRGLAPGLFTEKLIWAKRRPPLHLRDQIREGQRIAGQEIELFLVRPVHFDPTRQIEESIAKTRYVQSRGVWQVFWKRADGKWHGDVPKKEVGTPEEFLQLVAEDTNGCFWG